MNKIKINFLGVFLIIIFLISLMIPCLAVAMDKENLEEKKVEYYSHIENIGWERPFSKSDGELSGTEGKGLRLEAIKIKMEDLPENAKIQYEVHVQDIGWQEKKENGELAGTEGKGLRLEALKIKLINMPEYTVEYRVHIQDIGWQDWKQDGAIAGTQGKSLRLEALQIRIVPKQEKASIVVENCNFNNNESIYNQMKIDGWKYSNINETHIEIYIDDENVTENANIKYFERNDLAEKISYGTEFENELCGFSVKYDVQKLSKGVHTVKLKLMNENKSKIYAIYQADFIVDKNVHVEYQTHVQDIGWQENVSDGKIAGTENKSKRIEALKIVGFNLPENASIKYQTHVQNIGWQEWMQDGETAGTEGNSYRIEAIKIELVNMPEYSIEYRVHVQNIGWQEWRQDGAIAGTSGKSQRIEAIQIRIIPKEEKGKIVLDNTIENKTLYNEEVTITGWKMANVQNTKLKIYIDNKDETENSNLEYVKRNDLTEKILYGGDLENETPGFKFKYDMRNLSEGDHNLTLQLVSENGEKVFSVYSCNFTVDKGMHVEYEAHVQDIGWQEKVMDAKTAGTTGKAKRVEAIKIKSYNLPQGVKIKYQAHVQDIGWQNWLDENMVAGTNGKGLRLEAIKIKLENTQDYSIMYRAHVQDQGWQDWVYDGETAGTIGEGKRIEAIQIKITRKVNEEKYKIDWDSFSGDFTNEVHNISGWAMTNVKDTSVRILIDGNNTNTTIQRFKSQKVYNNIKGCGGEELNPTPVFSTDIDFSKYSIGKHTITAQLISKNGNILTQANKDINIKNKIEISEGTYGVSGFGAIGDSRGDYLRYYKYGQGPNVFYATFCVHGFEDKWAQDGTELVVIANKFWEYLKSSNNYDIANKWTIYIFPEVNPDGRRIGYTNNGPGRTTLFSNAPGNKGIDLNRCWSTDFVYQGTNRNYTGTEPFQAYEARYLRDFLYANKSKNGQTLLVDLHGWTQQLIGDSDIRGYYRQQFPENEDTPTYGKGYLINWARTSLGSATRNAKSALIELPDYINSPSDVNNRNLANRYINATMSMLYGIN